MSPRAFQVFSHFHLQKKNMREARSVSAPSDCLRGDWPVEGHPCTSDHVLQRANALKPNNRPLSLPYEEELRIDKRSNHGVALLLVDVFLESHAR